MDAVQYANYLDILKKELIPAMGCTEPIAVAYATAKAAQVLGECPESIHIRCNGNIIKNAKGAAVPNSGGMKGINAAAVLGAVGGDASKELEVLESVTANDREKAAALLADGICTFALADTTEKIYIEAHVEKGIHSAVVVISETHTNIVRVLKDGQVLYDQLKNDGKSTEEERRELSVRGILEFADCVRMEDIRDVIGRQIRLNTAISQEGLEHPYGAQIGKTLENAWGGTVAARACARAAAGSDARMGGCSMPVVINSGSGNQGITVSMPVLVYAQEWDVPEEKLYRALVVSNLTAVHQKYYIGGLSAYCGAVCSACGVGAGITYMYGGDYSQVSAAIINTLGNVGGIICDGAKPSCTAKIASSVNAAIMAFHLSMENKSFLPGDGIVEEDVEQTIKAMGYIGRVGMRQTDQEILNVMTGWWDAGCS